MRLIGVASVRGAPGVTTTSLLLASALPEPTLVLEADPTGGVLAVRYGLGREPGLTTFAASPVDEPDGWRGHAQDAGGVAVLVGPDRPQHARSLWRRASDRIAQALETSNATCVVDIGRIGDEVPLSQRLALLVVLVRPVADHLVTLSHQLPDLHHHAHCVGVVLVGDGEYRPDDVGDSLHVEVLGTLPDDERTAEALCGRARPTNLARSPLYRSAAAVAIAIDAAAPAPFEHAS